MYFWILETFPKPHWNIISVRDITIIRHVQFPNTFEADLSQVYQQLKPHFGDGR